MKINLLTTFTFSKVVRNKATHVPEAFPRLWKVVFYGSDTFSLPSLKLLNENRTQNSSSGLIESIEVVCSKIKSPVGQYAQQANIPLHLWPYSLPAGKFHLGVIVSFGYMIPQQALNACTYGMINVHPSLLPRWRGAAPVVHTILNGDKDSGVSVITVAPRKFDTGKILLQERCSIPLNVQLNELEATLSLLGANLLLKCLADLPNYLQNARPQPEEGVTKAPKVSSALGRIQWESFSCSYLDRLYRAVGSYVFLTTHWYGKRVRLFGMVSCESVKEARISELVCHPVNPGYCYYHPKRMLLFVKCQDGWVAFKSVSVEGSKRMSAVDFHNGFLTQINKNKRYFKSVSLDQDPKNNP